MIIDASDIIAGRLATFVAKKALLGETIEIVNSEQAVISGSKENIFARFKQKTEMGVPSKGPFVHRSPDKLMRRIIRNMLPFKQAKGKLAFKRIRCWKGTPEEFKGKEIVELKDIKSAKLPNFKYVKLLEVSRFLGGKFD